MSVRLTELADADIARILRDTLELFGPKQFGAYARLIELAVARVGEDARSLGAIARDDIAPGVRMLHLQTVARRRGAASHGVYFLAMQENGEPVSIVLRVLHDRMDPTARVASAILDPAFEAPSEEDGKPSDMPGS